MNAALIAVIAAENDAAFPVMPRYTSTLPLIARLNLRKPAGVLNAPLVEKPAGSTIGEKLVPAACRSVAAESRIVLIDASAFGVQRIGDTGSVIVFGTTVGMPLLPRIAHPFSSSS